jgi:hypothetical protein
MGVLGIIPCGLPDWLLLSPGFVRYFPVICVRLFARVSQISLDSDPTF